VSLDAWFTLLTVLLVAALLIGTRVAADLILAGGLTILILAQVITPAEALSGVANPGLWTVAVLYVVVAGLVDTGAVYAIGARLLGRPRSLPGAQVRLMLPVTAMSGFLNNTPVVAMLVPVVEDWARRWRLPVSRLMIPLSYAAIFGGTFTLIGTSTNLIVHGMMQRSTDLPAMGFFDIGAVGLPAAVVGIAFVLATGRWLLPDRRPPLREPEQAREYAIEMLVQEGSPLVGKSIEQAGLRQLPGAFLAEIERADALLPAVAPTERLRPGDRLLFVGVVESVLELVRVRGLVPAPEQLFKLDTPRPERRLFEVVVSDSSPVAGKSIREGGFRRRYEAVVIAVARNGERLRGKVGDIVLRPGDTLLLEGRPAFAEHQRNSRDFLLIHELSGSSVPRHDRAWVALSILALMVAAAASGLLSMFEAALAAAALTVLTRCATSASARASIDWSVLAVIGASLGIGQALLSTGAAAAVASWWLGLVGNSPWTALLGVYLLTSLFTSLITNNAAAVLIFPIALSAAEGLGVSPMPFVVAVMMAASASFATPISYQTNLMVYGPGGYRFSDYLRLGLPLNLLLGAVVVVLTPLVWPFVPDA
jgi:di/tricarboxylate transporter